MFKCRFRSTVKLSLGQNSCWRSLLFLLHLLLFLLLSLLLSLLLLVFRLWCCSCCCRCGCCCCFCCCFVVVDSVAAVVVVGRVDAAVVVAVVVGYWYALVSCWKAFDSILKRVRPKTKSLLRTRPYYEVRDLILLSYVKLS